MPDIKLYVETDYKLQIAHLMLYSEEPKAGARKYYQLTTDGSVLFEELEWGLVPDHEKLSFISMPMTFYEILSKHWYNQGKDAYSKEFKDQLKQNPEPAMLVSTDSDYLKLLISKQQNTIDKLISLWQQNLHPKPKSKRKARPGKATKRSGT